MKLNILNDETVLPEVTAPEITLKGNREAELDGVKRIIEINDSCLRVIMGEHNVKITGESIEISNAFSERIKIRGIILSLDFS